MDGVVRDAFYMVTEEQCSAFLSGFEGTTFTAEHPELILHLIESLRFRIAQLPGRQLS